MSEAPRYQLLTCDTCHGSDFASGRRCKPCHGIGLGILVGSMFLYWGRRIDGFALALERLQHIVDASFDGALTALGIFGLYALGREIPWVTPADVLTPTFWQTINPSFLWFWVGIAALSCLYYRRVLKAEQRQSVKQRVYGETLGPTMVPPGMDLWSSVWSSRAIIKVDVARSATHDAQHAIDMAYRLARRWRHAAIEPLHLFAGVTTSPAVTAAFARLGLKAEALKDRFNRALAALPQGSATVLSPHALEALLSSYVEAYEQRLPNVDAPELLLAVLRLDPTLQDLLNDIEINAQKVDNAVQWIRVRRGLGERGRRFSASARLKPKGVMNRAMTSVATPFLERLSTDLTQLAAYGRLAPSVGREAVFNAIFRAVEGGQKSVVLVGEHGVGKESVIEGLAQRMVEEDVPTILQDRRLISLDLARLVAGASPAQAQERLLMALTEAGRSGNIVLAVPHVAGMSGISAGGHESVDLGRVFADELAKGYIFAITTATPREYAGAIESGALGQALTKVDVAEPERNEAIQILETEAVGIEARANVFFSYDAVEAAVALSDRYLHEQFLPEKAIGIAREAAQAVAKTRGNRAIVTREDVAVILAEKTKIPLTHLTKDESARLLDLEVQLHARLIGQDEAVKAVSSALRRARAELRESSRPIANFLFLGPTGVGKTELAKAVAAVYFGSEDAMIRLDMSEYQDKSSLHRLIGAPGSEHAGGILTEAVRLKPFALVLLDELEKAHPDILTVFLQVMEDGRLTDNTGRTIDFTNTIIIATSNAGSSFIQDELRKGTTIEVIKRSLLTDQLKGSFRPEFLNRFDDIVAFSPLSEDEIVQITRLMLGKMAKQLADKGAVFEATEAGVHELAKIGFDPIFGARPLRRAIQDKVENKVAEAVLRGDISRRDRVIYDAGGIVRIERARKL